MLISFSVENFRSISDRQEITFVASRHQILGDSVVRNQNFEAGILPLVAIFGANGAGKSTLLLAMKFLQNAVLNSQTGWKPSADIPVEPHFFNPENPTEFECQFLLKGNIYRFGMSVTSSRVLREWLFMDKKLLYRRTANAYRFGPEYRGFSSIKSFTRSNSLFLSSAAQNNHPISAKIYAWFSEWDDITESRLPEQVYTAKLLKDPDAKAFLQRAIAVIDPHIVGIEPASKEAADFPIEGDQQFRKVLRDYQNWRNISFIHRSNSGESVRVSLSDESRGTQDYFSIIGSIMVILHSGGVMILDEAGASLHPMLLRAIVMLFQSRKTNTRGAQLIFSTHDVSLLSPDVLRPDEVWFAERRDEGSAFFSLADFGGIRSDIKAQKAYLEGRFGAVPFIEDHLDIFAAELTRSGAVK